MDETRFIVGLLKEDKEKIKKFLNEIYLIPFRNPKEWEKKIWSFFGDEVITPFLISTNLEEDSSQEEQFMKEMFFAPFENKVMFMDTNQLFENLIKIHDSLKTGMSLERYMEFFFINNVIIRRMLCKISDEEDKKFKEFKHGFFPYLEEHKIDGKNCYLKIFIAVPDLSLDYPREKYVKEIKESVNRKLSEPKKSKQKRKPIDSHLRHECFKRDGYKCVECGATNKEKVLHADHILPFSQGGKDELDNLQTLCEDCNLSKSNKFWKKE